MIPLLEFLIDELRRAIVGRIVEALVGELSARDVQMMLYGMVLVLLVMQLGGGS